MQSTDWGAWHQQYDDPGSAMSGRLAQVRAAIEVRLDETAAGPVRVVSACAGAGRDVLGVLGARGDAARVSARLVEYDVALAGAARRSAASMPADVDVVTGDAGASDAYAGAVPADLVLLCGIFGNVSDSDVRRTVAAAPQLCAPGAHVVWTRARRGPMFSDDLTPTIRGWFADAGFEEVSWTAPRDHSWSVGVHRLVAQPQALQPGERWFAFTR